MISKGRAKSDALNKKLLILYKNYWDYLAKNLAQEDVDHKKISCPLFIHIFPEYIRSKRKLLIIGQQTLDWGAWKISKKSELRKHIGEYKNFHLGEGYYNSPFWVFSRKLYGKLNPDSEPYGFLWLNINKCDQHYGRLNPEFETIICKKYPIFQKEINIIKPDVVVFVTGPNYNQRIRESFPSIKYMCINRFRAVELQRLKHEALPKDTFRTYHPQYLYRIRLLDKIINKICLEISKN